MHLVFSVVEKEENGYKQMQTLILELLESNSYNSWFLHIESSETRKTMVTLFFLPNKKALKFLILCEKGKKNHW